MEINQIGFFGTPNGSMKYNFIVFKNQECILETACGKNNSLLSWN